MKKMLFILLGACLMLVFVACGNKVDEETSNKYSSKAKEVVSLLNEANYKEIHEVFDGNMKVSLPEDDMNDLTPRIEESGNFKEYKKSSVEEKDGYYIVVLVADYSEKSRIYTITFNDQEQISGLYIK